MSTTTDTTYATTPPSTYTFGTDYEATVISSLAGTNTASEASYTAAYTEASTTASPTATAAASSSTATAAASSSTNIVNWWNGLSNPVHYCIYAAAGVVALLIIGLIVLVAVKSKRRKRKSVELRNRMTQRSSFGSPLDAQPPNAPYAVGGGMSRSESSFDTTEKGAYGTYANEAASVYSVPPAYGHAGSNNHNNGQYPPAPNDPNRATSPTYGNGSGRSGGRQQNPYAAFAQDDYQGHMPQQQRQQQQYSEEQYGAAHGHGYQQYDGQQAQQGQYEQYEQSEQSSPVGQSYSQRSYDALRQQKYEERGYGRSRYDQNQPGGAY